ncbi:MAG: polysaccharide pyruvyl transferase family protein, partial [Bdellovibrionales bacterium]|nr:polysaccharide pyruvyl transferase family protein [Bdellovibrionales bacterium]
FGKGFWNPAFNFLITLFLLIPFFKIFRCKLVCYNCGIGPFPVPVSRTAARILMNACDLITLRDEDSRDLALDLGVTQELVLTGDSAFTNPISSAERASAILKENNIQESGNHLLGVNVTVYIDSWLQPGERVSGKDALFQAIADAVEHVKKNASESVIPIIFCTQPMDEGVSKQLSSLIQAPIIDNSRYLSHDIQAVMQKTELLVGMRFHSLILASAVGTPIIGMNYAPKVRGYLRLLRCPEYGIELQEVASGVLKEKLLAGWNVRKELLSKQAPIVKKLTEGAHFAASELENLLGCGSVNAVEAARAIR